MKLRRKHIIMFAPGLVLFAMIAMYHLFPYLFKYHAQNIDSDYFLIACVVCATMPFTMTLLYVAYRYLQQLKEKQQAEEEKKFYSDYIEGEK